VETKSEFEDAIAGLRATGASVSATEVVKAIDRHGKEESELLTRYERFAEHSASPVAQYLVRLILDEERRHHRILEELANTIAWGSLGDPTLPELPIVPLRSSYDREFCTETRALLRQELRDRKQLRQLRRRLRSYGDAPFWGLLVELMGSDTEKHISILRFLQKDNRTYGLAGALRRAQLRFRSQRTRR
jgi:hypothetical protein